MTDLPASPSYIINNNNNNIHNSNNSNNSNNDDDDSDGDESDNDGEEDRALPGSGQGPRGGVGKSDGVKKGVQPQSQPPPPHSLVDRSQQEQENKYTGGQGMFSPLKKRGKPSPQSPILATSTVAGNNNNDNNNNHQHPVPPEVVVAAAKEVSKDAVEQGLGLGQGLAGQQPVRRARLVKGGGSLANL